MGSKTLASVTAASVAILIVACGNGRFVEPVSENLLTDWNFPDTSYESPILSAIDPVTKYHPVFDNIVDVVIKVVEKTTTPESRVSMIKKDVARLRLTSLTGDIPHLLDDPDVRGYVTRVAECGSHQEYFVKFLLKAQGKGYFSKFEDLEKMIRESFIHMVVLDRLTKAARNDIRILEKIYDTFQIDYLTNGWGRVTNSFERVKILTIDLAVKELMAIIKSGVVPPLAGRKGMPMNVIEATLEEFRVGEDVNARAGLIYAFYGPGHAEYNNRTGAGPTVMSKDGNGVAYKPHLSKKWLDGYSMWNGQFCGHYKDAPLFWGKLLNPTVLCYHNNVEDYLYTRIIALNLQLHHWMYGKIDNGNNSPDWRQPDLNRQWADHNLETAKEFHAELMARLGEPEAWYIAKIRRVFIMFGQMHPESQDVVINWIGRYVTLETVNFFGSSVSEMLAMVQAASWAALSIAKCIIFS